MVRKKVAERIGSVELLGAADSLTETFGYFASDAVWRSRPPACLPLTRSRAHAHVIDDQRELRVALRDAAEFRRPGMGQEHDGSPAFSAAGQNQWAVPSVSHLSRKPLERDPDAEHSRLLLPLREQRRRLRVLDRDAAHDGEATGYRLTASSA